MLKDEHPLKAKNLFLGALEFSATIPSKSLSSIA